MTYAIEGATQRFVELDDVTLSVYEAGSGPAVVLCHGFPELAYTWRHLLPAVAAAGFRAIAPDMRGFGGTSRPDEVTDYDMAHLTGDLVGMLDALGIDEAVFVGHDWGGLVVWQMPLRHRDRVAGVVGVNTPFLSRLPSPPIELFRMLAGDDHYMVWFQQPDVADRSLGRDIPGLFASLMRSGSPPDEVAAASAAMTEGSPFDRLMGGPAMGDPLLSDAEQAVYVEAFTETGFTPGINWYRNMDRNWEMAPEQDGARIDGIPCLMVVAEWDPVLVPALAEPMPELIDDLEMHLLARCGHWAPAERPDELAALVVDWLNRRYSA